MEVFSVENHPHPGWLSSKPCLIHQRVPHAATNWSQGAFPGGPINWGVTVVLPFAFRLQDVHLWSNRYEAILGSMKILQITSNIDRKNNELCGSMKQNKITPPTIWMSWSPMPSATKCDAIGAKGGGLGSAWARTATSGAEGPEIHRVSCRFSLKPIRQSIDTMWGHLEKDEKDCMRIDSPTWDLGVDYLGKKPNKDNQCPTGDSGETTCERRPAIPAGFLSRANYFPFFLSVFLCC